MRFAAITAGALLGVVLSGSMSLCAFSETCVPPTTQTSLQVDQWINKKFGGRDHSFVRVKSEQAEKGCFWRFAYLEVSGWKRVAVFLSPDGQFISPELYSLNRDPKEEDRETQQRRLADLLAAQSPAFGRSNAPVTIVEFSDFECPFCQKFATAIRSELAPEYRNNLRVIYKFYPLRGHPWARDAAEAAACAAQQSPEAFWQLHDFLFAQQRFVNASNFHALMFKYADSLLLIDRERFHKCVEGHLTSDLVERDLAAGEELEIHATPTFLINGRRVQGFHSSEEIGEIIASETSRSDLDRKARSSESIPTK